LKNKIVVSKGLIVFVLITTTTFQNCGDSFQSIKDLSTASNDADPDNNSGTDNNPGPGPMPGPAPGSTLESFKGKYSPLLEYGQPTQKIASDGKNIFFTASDGVSGLELWKFDTTTKANKLLADTTVGAASSDITNVTPSSTGVVFSSANATNLYYVSNQSPTPVLLTQANNVPPNISEYIYSHQVSNIVFYGKARINNNIGTLSYQTYKFENNVSTLLSSTVAPRLPVVLNGRTIFSMASNTGYHLYSYEGEAFNVVRLFPSGGPLYFSYVSNTEVYFFSPDVQACRLWRSDGTAAGTVAVYTTNNRDNCYIDNYPVVKLGTDVYFIYGGQLLKVDAAGNATGLGTVGRSQVISAVGNKVVFQGGVTNGTVAGTRTDANIGSRYLEFLFGKQRSWLVSNNKLYLIVNGSQLDLNPNLAVYDPIGDTLQVLDTDVEPEITAFNGRVFYFKRGDALKNSLFKSTDGTVVGTITHQDLKSPAHSIESTSAGVFFLAKTNGTTRYSPWQFDGSKIFPLNSFATQTDTKNLAEKYLGKTATKKFFVEVSRNNPTNGTQLISVDSLTGQSVRLDLLSLTPGSDGDYHRSFRISGGFLYYIKNLKELWRTDGTNANTALVNIDLMNPLNIFFSGSVAQRLIIGAAYPNLTFATWSVEGVNREKLADANLQLAQLPEANIAYFISSAGGQVNIGQTNGTTAGTTNLFNVNSINPSNANFTSGPFKLGNQLIFSTFNGASYQIWSLDITTRVATRLKETDLAQNMYFYSSQFADFGGPAFTEVFNSAILGNKVFFVVVSSTTTSQLWSTDGTAVGTSMVYAGIGAINNLRASGQNLFFYVKPDNAAIRYSLYSFDGVAVTQIRTGLVPMSEEVVTPTFNGYPAYAVGNGKAYFPYADAATGTEIWETDGTLANTKLSVDLEPGPTSSNPGFLGVISGENVFSANLRLFGRKHFSF